MHNIKKYVTQFRKEFHIRSLPTLDDLENIIVHGLYYKLLPYQGNEELFYSLVKRPDIKCKTAIAIRSGNQRYIFYNNDIPPQDRPYIFSHEIAHIYINHYSRDNGYMDTSYRKEREANEFATFLLQKPKKRIVTCIACAATAILVILYSIFAYFNRSYKNISIVVSVFNQSTPSEVNIRVSDNMVVTTTVGRKYHKINCSHVKNKTNLKTVTVNEAITNGYTPCLDCF